MPKYIPTIIETTEKGVEKSYDLYSRLMKDRIIVLDSDVNTDTASVIMASLLFMDNDNNEKPIHFYINSPGGCVVSGLQIYDTMKMIKSPVFTYVVGNACSMGSLLASSGDKRFISKYSRHMMHMVSAGNQGQIKDMEIRFAETKKLNEELMNIYVLNTGKLVEQVKEDLDRDKWLNAEECLEYGLVDEIMNYTKKNLGEN